MYLQELKEQALQLSTAERLELASALLNSLQSTETEWQYLVARPHPWRKQLHVKGHRLLAATVWSDLVANQMTPEQAAENWDLPLVAINEIICYCESHRALLVLEAEEERYRLESSGVQVESAAATG